MDGLKSVTFELYKNDQSYFALNAIYQGYGFRLYITDLDNGKTVFTKFLKTQNVDYVGNYLRKVVKNNFGAIIA